jgi:F-type H+-transporting ATPase subunit delta
MKISKQARRDGKALFNICRVNGVLDENRVRQAVSSVIEKKPRSYVATLSHFQRLVKLDIERRTARVESAVPLTDEIATSVKAELAWRYGQDLNLSFAVNKDLIGGLRVKVGSDVYDGSIRARLNELAEAM